MKQKHHRILYLSRGGTIYGAQRQLLYLLMCLDKDRYSPVVVCEKSGDFPDALHNLRIECIIRELKAWRKFKNFLSRYKDVEFLSQLIKEKDISLAHSSDLWLSEYLLRSTKPAKIPSVLHIRTPLNKKKFLNTIATKLILLLLFQKKLKGY